MAPIAAPIILCALGTLQETSLDGLFDNVLNSQIFRKCCEMAWNCRRHEKGGHRIRHYGLFAGTVRARNIERARQALAAPKVSPESAHAEADSETEAPSPARRCSCCGGRMIIIETFEGPRPARSPPPNRIRIDTS